MQQSIQLHGKRMEALMFESIIRYPDLVGIETEKEEHLLPGGAAVTLEDVRVTLALEQQCIRVQASAKASGLSWLRLRWNCAMPEGASYLGGSFERNYGQMGWEYLRAERFMPWYFLASLGAETRGYGVKVRPGGMCFWQCDDLGVTLWIDLRCGTAPVQLDGRTLDCAQVVCRGYEGCSSFEAAQQFCHVMCTDSLLPPYPVYGSNNWYYAYGHSSEKEILEDARVISELTEGLQNRPFMVVDSCWQRQCVTGDPCDSCAGGPNDRGNARFPDMPGLAARLKQQGLHPGIWMRFLENADQSLPAHWRRSDKPRHLDPSVPEVLGYIANEVRRARDWGYELLKYDFSTADILNVWGKDIVCSCTEGSWSFHDRSRTTAEIIVNFYRTIREAAPELILIGCNCIGHLGAGLMHLYRTGDDTSGQFWERTRRMGVNTLAFRLPEDGAFYAADADCVGIMGPVSWEMNRQWAHLLAHSGTPFFTSIKPGILTEAEKEELREDFRLASRQEARTVPLDWMTNTAPRRWLQDGSEVCYCWYEPQGLPRTF